MTWVKICGITNLEDAQTAIDAGADALGFVFYSKSPRYIDPEMAHEIVSQLPENTEKVGVFVDETGSLPIDTALKVPVSAIQYVNSISFLSAAGPQKQSGLVAHAGVQRTLKIFVSISIKEVLSDPEAIRCLASNFARLLKDVPTGARDPRDVLGTFFLDSGTLKQPGGTGKTFDWERAVPIAEGMREGGLKLVVAGGLTPDNVAEAMRILKPWGVDVASGVEARPGKKDPEKVRAFIAAVRAADKAV